MTSFPTELLYITEKMAGVGFKSPMNIITKLKLEIILRAQVQSTDAAGMLMRSQRHQQPYWCRFQGGLLTSPMTNTPNCWALSLLQHMDELGIEITLTPTPLLTDPPKTHNITEDLAGITAPQQKLVTVIEIQHIKNHIENLMEPEDRTGTPIACAHENLQCTLQITRPAIFGTLDNDDV